MNKPNFPAIVFGILSIILLIAIISCVLVISSKNTQLRDYEELKESVQNCKAQTIGEEKAGERVIKHFEDKGIEVKLISVQEEQYFYEVMVSFDNQRLDMHITKDGSNLITGLTPLYN